MFANQSGKPMNLNNLLHREILPALDRCAQCWKDRTHHAGADHVFTRDASRPEWHGWHAARRGLGSNLYALGVPEKAIQNILRHANVSTTNTYYIKTAPQQVTDAMAKLEQALPDSLSVNEVSTNHWQAPASPARQLACFQWVRMVALGRVELPTFGLGNRCSIHLSYRAIRPSRY